MSRLNNDTPTIAAPAAKNTSHGSTVSRSQSTLGSTPWWPGSATPARFAGWTTRRARMCFEVSGRMCCLITSSAHMADSRLSDRSSSPSRSAASIRRAPPRGACRKLARRSRAFAARTRPPRARSSRVSTCAGAPPGGTAPPSLHARVEASTATSSIWRLARERACPSRGASRRPAATKASTPLRYLIPYALAASAPRRAPWTRATTTTGSWTRRESAASAHRLPAEGTPDPTHRDPSRIGRVEAPLPWPRCRRARVRAAEERVRADAASHPDARPRPRSR